MTFFGLVQDKAQPSIVALILQACKSSAPTLEAYPFGLSQTDAVEGTIGAGGQCLGEYGIEMLGNPATTQPGGGLVQAILAEAILLSQRGEGRLSFLLARAGDCAGCLPSRICCHLPPAPSANRTCIPSITGVVARIRPF